MNTIRQSDYQTFLKEIKGKILEAQYNALKAVNLELIKLNWDIGKSIVEKQEQLGWGKSVVENLSKDLQNEEVLYCLSGKCKTCAIGARNWMES